MKPRLCPKCHHENRATAKFCSECGTVLRKGGCPRCGASNSFEEAQPLPAVAACPTCGKPLDR